MNFNRSIPQTEVPPENQETETATRRRRPPIDVGAALRRGLLFATGLLVFATILLVVKNDRQLAAVRGEVFYNNGASRVTALDGRVTAAEKNISDGTTRREELATTVAALRTTVDGGDDESAKATSLAASEYRHGVQLKVASWGAGVRPFAEAEAIRKAVVALHKVRDNAAAIAALEAIDRDLDATALLAKAYPPPPPVDTAAAGTPAP